MTTLYEFTRRATFSPTYRPLRFVDVDHDTWAAQQLEGRKLTGWDAVCKGLTLSSPTFTEYLARVAAIEAGARFAADGTRPRSGTDALDDANPRADPAP